jgi:hypothetical protein
MNSRQKEGFAASLNDEKAVLKELEKNYTSALADIKKKIKVLQADPATQSKAYQLDFQRQLEKQLTGILDVMAKNNFTSIDDYVKTCYQQGFLSTMYDLQGQGVPLVLPIDQKKVLKAVSKTGDDIKLSNKVGSSTKDLKKQVLAEMQRGFATQLSYTDIARNISSYGEADMHRSMLIARTEGGRIQNSSALDAMRAAKERGADQVKVWDSTFDSKTRESHAAMDGQVREIEEPFNSPSGATGLHPLGFGDPAEDCNCRCAMLKRARWGIEGETSYKKWNNETGGIIECSGYDDFKKKYLQKVAKIKENDIIKADGLNCYGDHLRKTLGSAIKNNPVEVKQIVDYVTQKGGSVNFGRSGKMVYNAPGGGTPGTIDVEEDISIAGLQHEYRHFLDDEASGFQGIKPLLADKDLFWQTELNGYNEELKIARNMGLKEEEAKILQEIELRRKEIYG